MTQTPLRASLRHLVNFRRCGSLQRSYPKRCQRALSCLDVSRRCIATTSSNSNDKNRILGRSTIFLQDGLDINEIPIVIRRVGPNEIFFKNELYGGVEVERVTARDEEFKKKLLGCETVKNVFKLLDVPDKEVTPYSAAFALQKLCSLQQGGRHDINSFVSRAILNELCETAVQGSKRLKNETVINLVRCYCLARQPDCYPAKFISGVNDEVETRIGDNKLKVEEVMSLLELVLNCVHADPELVSNLWIHLGNKYRGIREGNIALAYSLCKYMSKEQKYLYNLIDVRFERCWWKLSLRDAVSICQSLTLCNHVNYQMLSRTGQWVYINLHDIKTEDMKQFVALFSHFSVNDSNFVKSLERFFVAKFDKIDVTLVVMAMEFCRKLRHLSTKIFDLSAKHFTENAGLYGPTELYFTLRPFGQLNYSPHNANALFHEVESLLNKHFEHMEPHLMLELLVSFVCIERIPLNFYSRVFNANFFSQLTKSRFYSSRQGCQRTTAWLRALYASLRIDKLYEAPRYMHSGVMVVHPDPERKRPDRWFAYNAIRALFDNYWMRQNYTVKGTSYTIDFEIHLSEEGRLVPPRRKLRDGKQKKKVAIFLTTEKEYCVNVEHFVGEFSLKKRHLEKLGYHVVVIDTRNMQKRNEVKEELQRKLSEHVNFDLGVNGRAPIDESYVGRFEIKDEDLEHSHHPHPLLANPPPRDMDEYSYKNNFSEARLKFMLDNLDEMGYEDDEDEEPIDLDELLAQQNRKDDQRKRPTSRAVLNELTDDEDEGLDALLAQQKRKDSSERKLPISGAVIDELVDDDDDDNDSIDLDELLRTPQKGRDGGAHDQGSSLTSSQDKEDPDS